VAWRRSRRVCPCRPGIHLLPHHLPDRAQLEEERSRTKVIPRFTSGRSAMKLVFAALIRCSERSSRVSITDIERHQLHLLREELRIDPPRTMEEKEGRSTRLKWKEDCVTQVAAFYIDRKT
jgi:hypothetical protein